MAVVVGGEQEFAFFGGGDERITLGGGDSHRFFDNDMAAGVEALEGEWGVGVVGSNDDNEFNVRFFEHGGDRGISLDAREISFCGCKTFWVDFGNGQGAHSGLGNKFEVLFAHVEGATVADDADGDIRRFHVG